MPLCYALHRGYFVSYKRCNGWKEAVFLHIVENLVEKVEKQQSVKWKNWCRNEFKPNESHQKPRKYGIFLKKFSTCDLLKLLRNNTNSKKSGGNVFNI